MLKTIPIWSRCKWYLVIQPWESKAVRHDASHIMPLCAVGYRSWCAITISALGLLGWRRPLTIWKSTFWIMNFIISVQFLLSFWPLSIEMSTVNMGKNGSNIHSPSSCFFIFLKEKVVFCIHWKLTGYFMFCSIFLSRNIREINPQY